MYQPDDFDTELFAETVLIGKLYGLIAFVFGFFIHILASNGNPFESLESGMAALLICGIFIFAGGLIGTLIGGFLGIIYASIAWLEPLSFRLLSTAIGVAVSGAVGYGLMCWIFAGMGLTPPDQRDDVVSGWLPLTEPYMFIPCIIAMVFAFDAARRIGNFYSRNHPEFGECA